MASVSAESTPPDRPISAPGSRSCRDSRARPAPARQTSASTGRAAGTPRSSQAPSAKRSTAPRQTTRPARPACRPVEGEGAAVEDQLVLPAHQVAVHHRQAGVGDALAQHLVAQALLVHVEGRGVEHQQQLGTGPAGHVGGAGFPHVGADVDAHPHALEFEHAGLMAGLEVALLVEDLVVGQAVLEVGARHAAVLDHRGGVEALAGPLGRVADQHRDALHLRRQRVELLGAGLQKGRPQQQVFGRIAAQGEFGVSSTSAPAALARATASRIRRALPEMSPTTQSSWATATERGVFMGRHYTAKPRRTAPRRAAGPV
jgi:hypothetical protein